MSQPEVSISRAQLIAGARATGALAACGANGTLAVPTASPTCTTLQPSLATDRFGVNEIFSHAAFTGLDKAALLDAFDRSPGIDALHQAYLAQVSQQVQTSNVITQIPSVGIVIRTPGNYRFGNDITWSPGADTSSAITIACSDVKLDLAGFTLTASVSDKSRRFIGILVSGTVSNVAIANGGVTGFTDYGILARHVCTLEISEITVTGVCLQNLTVRNLTPTGIHVSWSDDVTISNCHVANLGVMTDSSAGIMLMGVVRGAVNNCGVNGLLNTDGAVQGFSLIGCIDVTTVSCKAESLQSQDLHHNYLTTGHTVLGFCPIFCLGLSYVGCTASGLIGCCDDCHGMSVFLDALVTVSGFQAHDVLDGAPPYNTGAKATGLEVYGAGVTVTDCAVNNIKAINPQNLQSAGFSAWGALIQFERCHASNVTVQDDVGAGSLGVGYGWAPDPRPLFSPIGAYFITYTDCTADRCDVAFDTWDHVDSSWIRPTFTNCPTGFLVEPGKTRILSCDGCSECNGLPPMNFRPGPVPVKNFESGNTYPQ